MKSPPLNVIVVRVMVCDPPELTHKSAADVQTELDPVTTTVEDANPFVFKALLAVTTQFCV